MAVAGMPLAEEGRAVARGGDYVIETAEEHIARLQKDPALDAV
jgi:hypothetical protein